MLLWLSKKQQNINRAGAILLFFSINKVKKIGFVFILLLLLTTTKSQNYSDSISAVFKENFSDIELSGKIIMIEFWSPDNFESRKMNKEMRRVWHIFQKAKMKDADKGAVLFFVSVMNNEPFVNMAMRKDSVLNCPSIMVKEGLNSPFCKLFKIDYVPTNVFINEKGQIIGKEISSRKIAKFMESQLIKNKH